MHSAAEYCGPVWCCSAHTCLIDHHQQRLANCDWMPASYTSGKPFNPRRPQPAELCRNGATLSLARRAMEPGHLLHSALTCQSSAKTRHVKSRHPFAPAAQKLISSFDNNNNLYAVHWADHQWNVGWVDNPTRLHIFIRDIGTQTTKNDRDRPTLLVSG